MDRRTDGWRAGHNTTHLRLAYKNEDKHGVIIARTKPPKYLMPCMTVVLFIKSGIFVTGIGQPKKNLTLHCIYGDF